MSRSGKRKAGELYDGWVWPEDYQFDYVQPGYKPPRARANEATQTLKQHNHPWLQFTDTAKTSERQAYLNRLAEIQDYTLESPRIIDWELLRSAGLLENFQDMFRVEFSDPNNDGVIELPMWERIFRLDKLVHREWCQEFYSTLRVALLPIDNIRKDRVIHFRLGGKQRHCTVAEFGYLCGMFERQEMEDVMVPHFLADGVCDLSHFDDEKTFHTYWNEISGGNHFLSGVSKVSAIKSKKLRILHKMITYSFQHRGNQNDKVYNEDLWLLRQFHEFPADKYACAPYILARHMQRHHERRYLCGHFVTSIMERLGKADAPEHQRWGTEEKATLLIGRTELRQAKLMGTYDSDLLSDSESEEEHGADNDDEAEEPQNPVHSQIPIPVDNPSFSSTFNFSGMEATLNQILGNQDMMMDHQRTMGTQVNRMAYQQEYWAPHINRWVQAEQPNVRPYSPPAVFMPASTTYGFFYPPQFQAGTSAGHTGATSAGGGIPQFGTFTQGERYSGHAYDFYAGGFFGDRDDPNAGDGVPSTFMSDDED